MELVSKKPTETDDKTEIAETSEEVPKEKEQQTSEKANLIVSGKIVAQDIIDPFLQQNMNEIRLKNCQMPQDLTYRFMALIGRAKHITALDFAGTNLGPNARNLVDEMAYWQPGHPLQELYLTRCNIFPQFCGAMLVHINKCHLLTHLDLSGNTIGSHGNHLADAIKSWGPKPRLKTLNLRNCFIPPEVCANIVSVLGRCEALTHLWLSGNSLTGCVFNFLPDPHPGLPALQEIFISKTGINEDDFGFLYEAPGTKQATRGKSSGSRTKQPE